MSDERLIAWLKGLILFFITTLTVFLVANSLGVFAPTITPCTDIYQHAYAGVIPEGRVSIHEHTWDCGPTKTQEGQKYRLVVTLHKPGEDNNTIVAEDNNHDGHFEKIKWCGSGVGSCSSYDWSQGKLACTSPTTNKTRCDFNSHKVFRTQAVLYKALIEVWTPEHLVMTIEK